MLFDHKLLLLSFQLFDAVCKGEELSFTFSHILKLKLDIMVVVVVSSLFIMSCILKMMKLVDS